MIVALLVAAWMPAAHAEARDIDVKVHDMKGVVNGEVVVELSEPGQTPSRYVCKDDGVAPDGIAGDHLYTARAEGLALDHGTVVVRAGASTWQGGFRFEETSDPVLLVGLEEGGFAAASTREVMFVPQDPMTPGGGGAPGGGMPGGGVPGGGMPGGGPGGGASGMPGGTDGGHGGFGPTGEPGGGGGSMGATGEAGRKATSRTAAPEGMWLGWGLAIAALGGLGGVAWAGAGRAPRVPPLLGAPPRPTTAARGPFVASAAHTDLLVGEGAGLRIGDGRWTPDEIALAALRIRGEVRVVVTDPGRVEADGDAFSALSAALSGVADLLWVEPAPR